MARTYTIRITDDETGAVIFAGRPTAQVQMLLASDISGRLVCDHCHSTVADDLAGMDAEEPDDERGEDGTARQCQHCRRTIRLRPIQDHERRGLVAKPLELASTAWADSAMEPYFLCSASRDHVHHPAP